ncbi:hypothetical protein GPECTOR_230g516 [Gonium pectorale]|uniref:Pherophorin domain-containing protein n=1 Tax=Gonium pectorale TaxID=33097 RepID=A0A150FWJ7_GONPE|nr:hypothetical protein GPECTOR_230g516 [Gonium pectorale]|eukprot:KXZ41981.1 hypothetical protein GPECTOR_230g516 [Gonium pectorale]
MKFLSSIKNFVSCSARCDTYDCACSPYNLTYLGASPGDKNATKHCFSIGYVGCNPARACCVALNQNVDKLALTTSADCQKSSVTRVELNGRNWLSWESKAWNLTSTGSAVGYELRIYDLQYNQATFPGVQICISVKEPCSGITDLCDINSGTCQ